jgi:hypothetical protein
MHRFTVQVNDSTYSRLLQLQEESSLPSIQSVLLSSFATHRLDIKPIVKKKKVVSKKQEPKIGDGNHPKDLKEVLDFFKGRVIETMRAGAAQQFYDYYSSNGWKQSNGNALKNWGAALTQWLNRNPNWRPIDTKYDKENEIKLKDFLDWALEARPPVFQKYKNAESIDEIDEHYIDEYRSNNDF